MEEQVKQIANEVQMNPNILWKRNFLNQMARLPLPYKKAMLEWFEKINEVIPSILFLVEAAGVH